MSLGIPDPMAMWHWVNDMNRGCGKVEDFPNIGFKPLSQNQVHKAQAGNNPFYCPDVDVVEQSEVEYIRLQLSSSYGVTLDLHEIAGCWDLRKASAVLQSVQTQDRRILKANGGQWGYRDFFPNVTVRMSSSISPFAAETPGGVLWISDKRINVWNNGYSYWQASGCVSGRPDGRCPNIFGPQLLTHEFGHALSNEINLRGSSLASQFVSAVPGDENFITDSSTSTDVSLWQPFSSGASQPTLARNQGRIYGNRLEDPAHQDAVTGEIGAEGYAVWVYGFYSSDARNIPDAGANIDAQIAFWDGWFSKEANLAINRAP